MATKKSVGVGYFGGNPKTRMSNVLAGDARTGGRAKFNQTSAMFSNSPYANRPAPLSSYAKAKSMPAPNGEAAVTRNRPTSVAGGLGIQGYGNPAKAANFRTPRNATTATRNYQYGDVMGAPIKTQVKPAAKKSLGNTIRTTVREKLTPTRKTGPQMGLNRVTGNTTGFTSGTTTGKTISKAGVATKTPMSASRRAEQNAFNKGGVAGPSRGGGGGMGKSSGGMGKSSGGGGRGMTGGGGMGASGRGTGGKR